MSSYEIWWDDLTNAAKERLAALKHDNVDLSPLAIVDVEEEEPVENPCPKCGEAMDVVMVDDDVGHGMHEELECPNGCHKE